MINCSELRYILMRECKTMKDLASELKISTQALYKKLANQNSQWSMKQYKVLEKYIPEEQLNNCRVVITSET